MTHKFAYTEAGRSTDIASGYGRLRNSPIGRSHASVSLTEVMLLDGGEFINHTS
jgi:hypothetical protein